MITATTYYGTRHTTSNRPIKNCSDMRGLKMRWPDVPPISRCPLPAVRTPRRSPSREVYLALQNGTVEAQENPLTTIEAKKLYECRSTSC